MTTLPFVANVGQHSAAVAFTARSRFGSTFVTREAALVHVLVQPRGGSAPARATPTMHEDGGVHGWSLVERFVGGDALRVRGSFDAALPISAPDSNGHLVPVPTFSSVVLPGLYPRVDLTLVHGSAGIERVYRVRPGGNAQQIRVAFEGATRLSVATDGRMLIDTPVGVLAQSRPVAWQETSRGRVAVAVRYRVDREDYGFELGAFDHSKSLYIDPILAATYVGGSDDDEAGAVAVHPLSGEVYVSGSANSIDFPGIAGGAVSITTGGAFVARFDATLETLLQATLLPAQVYAGTFTRGRTLAIHPGTGDVYVTGRSAGSFPGVATCNDGLFIARLAADLRSLAGAACYSKGGMQHTPAGVVIGPGGDVYLSGTAFQFSGGDPRAQFVVIPYPFIVRYSGDLRTQTGLHSGGGGAIAVHPATGDVYSLGLYYSNQIARLSPTLAVLGSTTHSAHFEDIAVHAGTGQVYVTGFSSGGVPGTSGGAQPAPAGGYDAFASRLTADLATLVQSTYIGGSGDDFGIALAIDAASGDVFVAGTTRSTDLPGTATGAQPAPGGGIDGFIARFSPSLTVVRQTTYYGGGADDRPTAIAIHPVSGELIGTGNTTSLDLLGTTGSAQPSLSGYRDGFVARITSSLSAAGAMLLVGGDGQRTVLGHAFRAPLSVRIVDVNAQPVAGVSVTFALPAAGASATFLGSGITAVVITGADGAATSPPIVANLNVGAYVASGSAASVGAVAFQLANDPVATDVPTWSAFAYFLSVLGLGALAARRLRRRE